MEYPIGVIIWVVIKITDQTIFWPNLSSQRRCNSFTTLPFMAVVLYKKSVIFLRFSIYLFLDCMFLHVKYGFQSESTLYSCLDVKELLAQSRHEIWSLSDCNWTRTHNHLVYKQTLNHLAKLAKWGSCVVSTYL